MKLRCTVENIQEVVESLIGCANVSTSNPDITSMFLIEPEDDKIFVWATNKMVEQTRDLSAMNVSEKARKLVPAQHLANICANLPADSVLDLDLSDDTCMISSAHAKYKLLAQRAGEFPKQPGDAEKISFRMQQRDLKFLLDQTSFCIPVNDPRYYLNGIFLSASKESIISVATDGHRLAFCELKQPATTGEETKEMILPTKFVTELGRILKHSDDFAEISVSTKQAVVATDQFTLATVPIEGKYPDYRQVLPSGFTWTLEMPRETLILALKRVLAISDTASEAVSVGMTGAQLTLSSKNSRTQEEATVPLEAKSEGAGFDVGFNGQYLLDAVSALEAETVLLEMKDSGSAAQMRGSETSQSLFVIMPVRI